MLALTAGRTSDAQLNSQASFNKGQRLADQTLMDPQTPDAQLLGDTAPIGYVIAEGDSWFAYPGLDVLGALKGRTLPGRDYYKVYSAASPGDTVESMAYDSDQLEGFADEFRKVLDAGKQEQVKAIVLSGGGNDIAGKEFHVLLNHERASSNSALDSAVADAFIDRIGRSLESLIGTSARYASEILGLLNVPPIIIHGYAPPVPDGRPFGIGWPLPGPWLEPGFTAKGYPNYTIAELERNTLVMADLIKRFNVRVSKIPANLRGRADVRYVDVTAALKNTVPGYVYKSYWSNELHPTDTAFKSVAEAIHRAIQQP